MTASPHSLGIHALARFLATDVIADEDASSVVQAIAVLKRSLLENELQPGEKVSIDEIARRLGTSRTPVREAMHRLEGEELIVSMPHRGYVVRKLDRDGVAALFQARLCIEPFVTTFITRNNTRFIADLSSIQEHYRQLLETSPGQRRIGIVLDRAFHLRITQEAGNPYLSAMNAKLFDGLIFTRPLTGFPIGRAMEAIHEHDEIIAALKAVDLERARGQIERHLRNGAAAITSYMDDSVFETQAIQNVFANDGGPSVDK